MNDTVLFFGYVLTILLVAAFNYRSLPGAAVSCFSAALIFALSDLMIRAELPADWFHLVIGCMCLAWAYFAVIYLRAIFIALAVSALAIFQFVFSLDSHLYPDSLTALLRHYEVMATALHALILLATITNGIIIPVGPSGRASRGGSPL